jgi:hypothetical protein
LQKLVSDSVVLTLAEMIHLPQLIIGWERLPRSMGWEMRAVVRLPGGVSIVALQEGETPIVRSATGKRRPDAEKLSKSD